MMRASWLFLLPFAVLLSIPVAAPARAAEAPRFVPQFEADTSQVPDLQPWGRAAEALCQVWYPRIVDLLQSDDSVRPLPPRVKITFEKDMKGVAYVTGTEMHIAADWVRAHPNDMGMVIHELTHLVQRYDRAGSGWLVEGIADYIRAKYFEPALATPRINFDKAKYTDSYKTTAAFLIWTEKKYGADLVPTLHSLLRERMYSDASFKEFTGKDVSQLWSEFAEATRTTATAK